MAASCQDHNKMMMYSKSRWKQRSWIAMGTTLLLQFALATCFPSPLPICQRQSHCRYDSRFCYGGTRNLPLHATGGGGGGGASASPMTDAGGTASMDSAVDTASMDSPSAGDMPDTPSSSSSSTTTDTAPSAPSTTRDSTMLVWQGRHYAATVSEIEARSHKPDHDLHQQQQSTDNNNDPDVSFIEQDLKNVTSELFENPFHLQETVHPPLRAFQESSDGSRYLTRREAMRRTATLLVAGTVIGGGTVRHQWEALQHSSKKIGDLNYTRIIRETSVEITVDGPMVCEALDSKTLQKVQKLKLPGWVPSFLVPPPKVIHDTTNSELLVAAAIAGSIVEMGRTSLLYPLLTLKTRVQTDVRKQLVRRSPHRRTLHLRRRFRVAQLQARKHLREGQLYAGILPSLIVSVPATGVYFGVRDVVQRKLLPFTDVMGGSITVAIVAAFLADVSSLLIRTPADTLALRLQAATGEEAKLEEELGRPINNFEKQAYLQEKIGNWFLESFERLPAVILTDLPYLLSRIVLIRIFLLNGPVSLGRYEGIVLLTALLCGLLTTPFDVARTRILVDSDDDPTNGIDGGSGEGLFRTFETITKEGDGGFRNLFAGWLERVAYLGIGRAWIEPLQILGYIAIRDFILLEWF